MPPLKIRNHISDRLSIGVYIYRNIKPKSPDNLNEFFQRDLKELRLKFEEKLPDSFTFTRKLYKAFSIDPTKTRPASEKLWRRVKKYGELPAISPIVDLTNHLSLTFQVPFGLYDLNRIDGDVDIDEGTEFHSLLTIGNMEMGLEGKIMLTDETGPFGNPTADSKRTATSTETKSIMQCLYFHPRDPSIETAFSRTLAVMSEFFKWEEHHQEMLSQQTG